MKKGHCVLQRVTVESAAILRTQQTRLGTRGLSVGNNNKHIEYMHCTAVLNNSLLSNFKDHP